VARKDTGIDGLGDRWKRAEKKVPVVDDIDEMSPSEIRKVIHDLRVQQIELEMQNEELRRSRLDIAELHQRYSDLYDLAPIGYFTLDEKGMIVETNVAGVTLLGYTNKSLVGQRFDNFVDKGQKGIFRAHLQKALENEGRQSCKLRFSRRDGKDIDALIETVATVDDEGRFLEYRVSVTDITWITRVEEALRQSEERYRHIVQDSTELIIRADADGRITFVNEALCRYSGMGSEQLLGKNVADFVPDGEGDAALKFLTSFTPQQQVQDIEYRVVMPNGDVRWHLWTVRAIYSKDKRFIEFQGAGRDITDRKRVEMELEERTRRLEEVNKDLESFSYSVSHDLRAPLRAIDGYARLILKKKGEQFDADTLDKFNVIRSSTHLMGQLIDDLLTFSRLGRKHMSKAALDMNAVMKDAWKEVRMNEPERNVRFTIKKLPTACGDMALIRQVCINLLSNAAKFTKYRDTAEIEAGGYVEGNECVYYIKDNGAGFDMAYYDKLFGVFQRLHSMEHFEGTGVGLAMVQRIIHRHNGRVWAEGKVDGGACFYFTLNMKE